MANVNPHRSLLFSVLCKMQSICILSDLHNHSTENQSFELRTCSENSNHSILVAKKTCTNAVVWRDGISFALASSLLRPHTLECIRIEKQSYTSSKRMQLCPFIRSSIRIHSTIWFRNQLMPVSPNDRPTYCGFGWSGQTVSKIYCAQTFRRSRRVFYFHTRSPSLDFQFNTADHRN